MSTVTVPQRFRRGYIESWNVFVQQDFGAGLVGEVGYVGTHEVRQISNLNINAAPIPSSTSGSHTPCNSNIAGCNYNANRQLNLANCSGASLTCYNNTDINSATPLFSSAYSGLQAQLSRRVGRGAQFGLVYTWSKAIDFADNSNYSGLTFAYPAYWRMNRAVAGYDRTNDLQLWTVYKLPFGTGEAFLNHGVASAIFGGFQLNTRLARVSGTPFTITTNNNLNAPGNGQVADVTGPLQLSHASHAGLQGNQLPYFSQSSFAGIPSGVLRFGTAGRNSVRGPGYFNLDASVFRDFHIWREANFQLRFETFDALNTPQFQNPNANKSTGGNFGYVTNTNASRNVQLSGRINF